MDDTTMTETPAAKHRGRSPYRGVSPRSYENGATRFRALLYHGGKQLHLGWFHSEMAAVRAFDREARQLGLLDRLNFPNPAEMAHLAQAEGACGREPLNRLNFPHGPILSDA
jgi:hypothetical protein